jgi:hypothetical protein
MTNNHEIEIVFDEVSKEYYVIWEPPVAIGSGKTELEALKDLQEVAYFSIASLIDSRREKISPLTSDKEDEKPENRDPLNEKARKIVALLPKENCGKCGFNSCGEFAMAVVQGHASPYGCRKQPSSDDKISEIMGIAVHKGNEQCDNNVKSHHFRIPAQRHHRGFGGGIFFHHIHHNKHHHGKSGEKHRVDK